MELGVVCRVATEYLARYGVLDRVDTLEANMFADPWPRGYNAVFFSNIFHDWDLARAVIWRHEQTCGEVRASYTGRGLSLSFLGPLTCLHARRRSGRP